VIGFEAEGTLAGVEGEARVARGGALLQAGDYYGRPASEGFLYSYAGERRPKASRRVSSSFVHG
jgi:hypothetical protein